MASEDVKFNMIGEYLSETINSLSADTLTSIFGLDKAESKMTNKSSNSSTLSQNRRLLNQVSTRRSSAQIPIDVWTSINKSYQVTAKDVESLSNFKHFLSEKALVNSSSKTSIFDLRSGEIKIFQHLRNRLLQGALKLNLQPDSEIKSFKTLADGIMIFAVAGGRVPYSDFDSYKHALLDEIGINDKLITTLSEKVNLKQISSKVLDQIDADELLNGIL